MTPTPKKFARPTIRTPKEDAEPAGVARVFAEVDVGAGPGLHVSIELKITVRPGTASSMSQVVREPETLSAELSDQQLPDRQFDAPGDGPYIVGLFGTKIPTSRLKTRRRRFGRRR